MEENKEDLTKKTFINKLLKVDEKVNTLNTILPSTSQIKQVNECETSDSTVKMSDFGLIDNLSKAIEAHNMHSENKEDIDKETCSVELAVTETDIDEVENRYYVEQMIDQILLAYTDVRKNLNNIVETGPQTTKDNEKNLNSDEGPSCSFHNTRQTETQDLNTELAKAEQAPIHKTTIDNETPNTSIRSIGSLVCRICHNAEHPECLISPCSCKGSLTYVHVQCLERWIATSRSTMCELCKFNYNTVQTLRYSCFQSLRLYYSRALSRRVLQEDCQMFSLLTLVAFGIVGTLLVGMQYIFEEGKMVGASKLWTKAWVIFFLTTTLFVYIVNIYMIMKQQLVPWYRWWQSARDIRLILENHRPFTLRPHQRSAQRPLLADVEETQNQNQTTTNNQNNNSTTVEENTNENDNRPINFQNKIGVTNVKKNKKFLKFFTIKANNEKTTNYNDTNNELNINFC